MLTVSVILTMVVSCNKVKSFFEIYDNIMIKYLVLMNWQNGSISQGNYQLKDRNNDDAM